MEEQAYKNTDVALFTDPAGVEVFRTQDGGGLGVNVGGHVIVKPAGAWHALAKAAAPTSPSIGGWIRTSERRPAPGSLIVKRWKHNGSVWAGVYSGTDKDSSFDEWCALPADSTNSRGEGGLASFRSAQALAERFHEAYERLAPSFGYTTRPETRSLDLQSANGRLMVAVCQELLSAATTSPSIGEGADTIGRRAEGDPK